LAFTTFLVWRLLTGACGVGAIECPPKESADGKFIVQNYGSVVATRSSRRYCGLADYFIYFWSGGIWSLAAAWGDVAHSVLPLQKIRF